MEQQNIDVQQSLQDSLQMIFTKNNIIYFITFLAVYLSMSYLLRNSSDTNSSIVFSRFIDAMFLIIFLIWIALTYFQLSAQDRQHIISWIIKESKAFFDNPTTVFTILIILIIFYITVYICRVPMTSDTKPVSIDILESKLWLTLVTALFFDFFKYFLGINLSEIIFSNMLHIWNQIPIHFSKEKPNTVTTDPSNNSLKVKDASGSTVVTQDSSKNVVLPNLPKPEVFHVSNNLYTYDDAQAVCKAFNARLATYDEVEDSYNDGGEWCGYGWSENQMALFPTQKSTWTALQNTKNHKNDCGRPGINGGYIANPNVKFGVNCFGMKPAPKQSDLLKMQTKVSETYPKTNEDLKLDAKVKYWKDNADKLLVLNPFNRGKWSEY